MNRVVKVHTKSPTTLRVIFDNGHKVSIDIASLLKYEAFAPLADPDYFAKVKVDDIGGLYWPNGADLSPEWIAQEASEALSARH